MATFFLRENKKIEEWIVLFFKISSVSGLAKHRWVLISASHVPLALRAMMASHTSWSKICRKFFLPSFSASLL